MYILIRPMDTIKLSISILQEKKLVSGNWNSPSNDRPSISLTCKHVLNWPALPSQTRILGSLVASHWSATQPTHLHISIITREKKRDRVKREVVYLSKLGMGELLLPSGLHDWFLQLSRHTFIWFKIKLSDFQPSLAA